MSKISWITLTLKRTVKCCECECKLDVGYLVYIRIDDNNKQYTFCDKKCHDEWEHKNNILHKVYGEVEEELVFDNRPPVINEVRDEKALNFS